MISGVRYDRLTLYMTCCCNNRKTNVTTYRAPVEIIHCPVSVVIASIAYVLPLFFVAEWFDSLPMYTTHNQCLAAMYTQRLLLVGELLS